MPAGQPTKYKPEYCALLIEHMKKGLSYECFGAVVGTCKQTIYNWEKDNPEFLDAKNKGRQLSQMFWESIFVENIITDKGTNFNTTGWIFNMKNRFNWRDKQEISGDEEKPLKLCYNLDE